MTLTSRRWRGALTTLTRNIHSDLDSPYRVETDEVTIWPRPSGETTVLIPNTMALQQGLLDSIDDSQDGDKTIKIIQALFLQTRTKKGFYGNCPTPHGAATSTSTSSMLHSTGTPQSLQRTPLAPPPTNRTSDLPKCAIAYREGEAQTHSKNPAILPMAATTQKG